MVILAYELFFFLAETEVRQEEGWGWLGVWAIGYG